MQKRYLYHAVGVKSGLGMNILEITLKFTGRTAENNQIDLYDAAQALVRFKALISIDSTPQPERTQAPSPASAGS